MGILNKLSKLLIASDEREGAATNLIARDPDKWSRLRDTTDIRDTPIKIDGFISHNGRGIPNEVKSLPEGVHISTARRLLWGDAHIECVHITGENEPNDNNWTWGPRWGFDMNDFDIIAYNLINNTEETT